MNQINQMKIKAIEKKSYIFIYRRPKYSKTSEMSLNITHIPQNSYKETRKTLGFNQIFF